jgi:hypothetical protein
MPAMEFPACVTNREALLGFDYQAHLSVPRARFQLTDIGSKTGLVEKLRTRCLPLPDKVASRQ